MMQGNDQSQIPDIKQSIELNAPVQKVWDAVSTSDAIAAWFMPNTFQPELGNEFTIQSPYGTSVCKVTDFDPPHRLAFTWGEDWLITFELSEQNGKTLFTLTHAGWTDKIAPTGEQYSVVRERMNQGWGSAVLPRLREYVEASA